MPGKTAGKDKVAKKSKGADVNKKPASQDKPKKEKPPKGDPITANGKNAFSTDGSRKGSKSKGKGKGKGKKGKKGKKKKGPRCPVVRYKKALKNVCYENENPTAVLSSYFVCHGVQEMLKFRKFIWKKKQKPIPPLEPEPKMPDKPWGFG